MMSGDSPQRLKYQAEMAAVFERPLEPDNVLLVARISIHELPEDVGLLLSRAVPVQHTEDTSAHPRHSRSMC